MSEFKDGPVADRLTGEVWPAADPGADPVLYGHAEMRPSDPVVVRRSREMVSGTISV